MAHTHEPDSSSGSDRLTIAVVGFLTLIAVAGTLFCLIYAVWWLVVFWAP